MIRFLVFLSLLTLSFSAHSAKKEVSVEIEKIKKEYEVSRQEVLSSDELHRNALYKIFELNKKIKKISEEKGKLTDNLIKTESNVKKKARKIAFLQRDIKTQKKDLVSRLRFIYKLSGQSYIRAIFSSTNLEKLQRNLRFLSILSDRDYEAIKLYEKDVARLKKERAVLKDEVKKLVKVKKEIQASENELIGEQRQKARLVEMLKDNRSRHLKKMIGMKKEASFLASYFFEQKGRLNSPSEGAIVQDFGLIGSEFVGVQLSHKGWRFSSKSPDVYSVFGGEVSFLGEIDGYGKVMIIDHKDHYYTVYGFLSESFAKKGDKIASRQRIATVTGNESDQGLYFEIRHYSQPENPKLWVKEEGMQISSADSSEKVKM